MILVILSFLQMSFAWTDLGHEVVGEIAEQNLSPTAKNFVRGVLGIEPLAVAATWPDHVRLDSRFKDFAPFHYCDVPQGSALETITARTPKNCFGVITNAIKMLKEKSVNREAKMIALRYLIHVVGDVHQPLHIGNGTDLGANTCEIHWRKGSHAQLITENLHLFWDLTMVEQVGLTIAKPAHGLISYKDYASALKREQKSLFESKTASTPIIDWLHESQNLRDRLYPLPKNHSYCSSPHKKIPTLDDEYVRQFSQLLEEQLVKAGLRLAFVLNELAQTSPTVDDNQEQSILQSVVKGFSAE